MFLLLTASSSYNPCRPVLMAACEWVDAVPRRMNSLFRMLGDRSLGRSDRISPLERHRRCGGGHTASCHVNPCVAPNNWARYTLVRHASP